MVVDGDVKRFPALAGSFPAVAMDAVPHTVDRRQFLDVVMDELAGVLRSYRHGLTAVLVPDVGVMLHHLIAL